MFEDLLGGGGAGKMTITAYKSLTGKTASFVPKPIPPKPDPTTAANAATPAPPASPTPPAPADPMELSTDAKDQYTVQLNPETYMFNYQLDYTSTMALGTSGGEVKFHSAIPPVVDFDFLFDGTGVIPPAKSATASALQNIPFAGVVSDLVSKVSGTASPQFDVSEELLKFSNVVYDYSGKDHCPRKVKISWGTLTFDCVLLSMRVQYKVFTPDGKPLRANVHVSFQSFIPDFLRQLMEGKSSPDLTHVRSSIAGDKLPLMVNTIYGSPYYYINVAKANNLFSFRKLLAGTSIFFPPVDKSSK